MKRTLLLLVVLLSINAYSQNKLYGFGQNEHTRNLVSTRTSDHRTKTLTLQNFIQSPQKPVSKGIEVSSADPDILIEGSWGTLYNVDTGKESYMKLDYEYANYNYQNVTVGFLDNDFNELGSATIALPDNTNSFRIEYERTNAYFVLFIHYFEGGVGPDFQVNELLFVDDEGTIIKRMRDRDGLNFFGNKLMITSFDDYNPPFVVHFLDPITFEEEYSITIDPTMIINFMGSVLLITEFEGETYLIVSYYEKEYMDMETYEMLPDNRLCMDVYNTSFERVKEVRMPLIYPGEDSFYVLPMPEVGMFLPQFDITRHIFNDDDKWEFMMPYYTMTMTGEWHNYYVINEDGEIIKSYADDSVMAYMALADLEGFDTMTAFIVSDEEGNQQIQYFNVESWEPELKLNARHNGELLSMNMERVKVGDDFEYLIGLGNTEVEGNLNFGVIKQYDRQGVETKKIRLPLGEAAESEGLSFQPGLTAMVLNNPQLFDTDLELDYIYLRSSSLGSSIRFAKANATEPFFVIAPDEGSDKQPDAYMFLYDENGIPVKFSQDMKSWTTGTESRIYNLPLVNSNVNLTIHVEEAIAIGSIAKAIAEGASVSLANESLGIAFEGIVDTEGNLVFDEVFRGTYTITIAKEDFDGVEESVTINPEGDSMELDYTIYGGTAIDQVNGREVNIYPNPVSDKLFVKGVDGVIRLYDISGRLLEVVKAESNETTIDMSAYSKGVYMISVGEGMYKIIRN